MREVPRCKVAVDVAKRPEMEGKTIVVLQASSGIRYVNHPMWDPEREEAALALPSKPASAEEPLLLWRSEDHYTPDGGPKL